MWSSEDELEPLSQTERDRLNAGFVSSWDQPDPEPEPVENYYHGPGFQEGQLEEPEEPVVKHIRHNISLKQKNFYKQKYYTKDNDKCSICFKKLKNNVCMVPHCGHLFHCKCIKQWVTVHPTCPICRKDTHRKDIKLINLPPKPYSFGSEIQYLKKLI